MQVDSLCDEHYIVMVGIQYTKSGYFCSYLCIFIVTYVCYCYVYVFLLLYMFCFIYSVFIVPAGTLRLPWLKFFRAFSSVVRQMPRYNSQRRGTARTLPKLIVLFYVLFVCKCVLYYYHRVSTQIQLTNIQGVPGGMCNTSGGCSLGQTIPT